MKKGMYFVITENSDRVLERHPLIKTKKVHTFKWTLFPQEGFASAWSVLQILWALMLDWG